MVNPIAAGSAPWLSGALPDIGAGSQPSLDDALSVPQSGGDLTAAVGDLGSDWQVTDPTVAAAVSQLELGGIGGSAGGFDRTSAIPGGLGLSQLAAASYQAAAVPDEFADPSPAGIDLYA